MKFVTRRNVFAAVMFLSACVGLPRSSEAQFMGKAGQITVKLTIPEGVTKMRGLLAFTATGLGPSMASDEAWKAMAKRLSVGMITVGGANEFGDATYPTRCAKGEFQWLLDAITDVAKTSNHPEIAHAPIAGHGHSHGGDYWNYFNACHPERMALIFCKSSGGVQYSKGALKTPMVWEVGMNDLKSSDGDFRGNMLAHRDLGTQMALVLGPGETHGGFTAGSRAMVVELIEAIFNLRVPAEVDTSEKPVALLDIDEKGGGYWLGDDYSKEIGPYKTFAKKDPLSHTSFLPTEALAMKWKAYGAQLPASIMLEKGTCSGCYKTPPGEPEATPNNAGPAPTPTPPTSDGGAVDPGTGGSTGSGGNAGSGSTGGTGGSSTGTDPVAPSAPTADASAPSTPPSSPPPSTEPKPTAPGSGGSKGSDDVGPTTGGCVIALAPRSTGAVLPLAVLGVVALLGRRRRRSR
jgi:hypothetical protein